MLFVVLLVSTSLVVSLTTVEMSWWTISLSVLLSDTWCAHALTTSVPVQHLVTVLTSGGQSLLFYTTAAHVVLLVGIAAAMHGVATYAHCYMGYGALRHCTIQPLSI